MAQLLNTSTMEFGMTSSVFVDYLCSPLGQLEITANQRAVTAIRFISECTHTLKSNNITTECIKQLREYFDGNRQIFTLPLQQTGTEFQQQVWQQLLLIPYATTSSYSDLAQAIRRPKAARAVGAANGRNPYTIVVPCHRVIGANGSLTGYAWGTKIKEALLKHEKSVWQLSQ